MKKDKPGVEPNPDKEVAIKVENLTKSFKIPLEASSGIKQKLINVIKGVKGYREFTPLNDISFEINKGDFFGIVGRNGSGKSTLLKTMAGIYEPESGSVTVNGSLVPFIELGVGFNPELTGRENVFLNGALLGFSHGEMEGMYQEIVDFAEIEEFMDEKLKNYSSGMQVRLAFSIAIQAKGDILLLDEVLAVGDEAFQRKCFNYFAELKREKKTVVLVTHSMDSVLQFCNKAALIDKEKEILIGDPYEVASAYRELNMEERETEKSGSKSDKKVNKLFSIDAHFKKKDDKLTFNVNLLPLQRIKSENLVLTFTIHKSDGEMIYRFTSDERIKEKIDFNKRINLDLEIENVFPDGSFIVQVAVKEYDRSKIYAMFDRAISFSLSNGIGKEFWRPEDRYELGEQK